MDVLWLGEAACHDVQQVGGKAANLSLLAADFNVPTGFCIPASLRDFCLGGARAGAGSGSRQSQALLDLVAAGYQVMAERSRLAEPSVAVRSSAIEEDGRGASFAGQFDTYLNLKGPEAVADAVLKCWDSESGDRMLSYRAQQNLTSPSYGIAILVQQLIPADVSGVAFSANPITGSRDEVMINAAWGLGESVVSGMVTPDTLVVGKADARIREKYLGEKAVMTVQDESGTKEETVPNAKRQVFALEDPQVAELTRLAMDLEQRMGWPVDLEFAYHDNQLYLLQCRPITTL